VPDHLSDPSTIAATVGNALGVTALVDELVGLVPQARSSLVFWPGYDESLSWGGEPDLAYRRQLGVPDDVYVVAYTGNLHAANAHEIRSLYLAVALLNRRGWRVRLVRTGADYALLTDHGENLLREFAQDLGFVPRTDLPRLLSIADVLVQPGVPDAFNIYRFPSKLPEFLASGRPVVLPACNIGAYLANGEEAIVLPACNAVAIVEALEKLLPDRARRIAIGKAGARFAAKNLQWSVAASRSLEFFERLLVSDPRP
jgi:glycosyltransferase involved in cell wall biosynthesis